jgi:hypothetical protein
VCVDAGARARVLGRVGDVLFLRDRAFSYSRIPPGAVGAVARAMGSGIGDGAGACGEQQDTPERVRDPETAYG